MMEPVSRIAGNDVEEQPLAIGFSDLRGFSSYTIERGDREAFRLVQRFNDLVDHHVSNAGGQVLKTYGDGVMTTFDDVAGALQCAAEMQHALSDYNEANSKEPLSAGIGLSWGTVIRTDDDVFGHSVNFAKRLADVAKGGQVIVSSELCDRTDPGDSFCLRDLGEHDVKGLGSHRIFELIWRDEVASLCLVDDSLNVVLTEDEKLVLEFAKSVKDRLADAQQKLLAEADTEGRGVQATLRRQIARRLSSRLPKWIDSMQARSGLGVEHRLADVRASLAKGKLIIQLPSGKKLSFDEKDVDFGQAQRFVDKLHGLKQAHPAKGRRT